MMCLRRVHAVSNSGVGSFISSIQSCRAARPDSTAVLSTKPRHLFGPPPSRSWNSTKSQRLYHKAFSSIMALLPSDVEAVFYAVQKVHAHLSDVLQKAPRLFAAYLDSLVQARICITAQVKVFLIDNASVVDEDMASLHHFSDKWQFARAYDPRGICLRTRPLKKSHAIPLL